MAEKTSAGTGQSATYQIREASPVDSRTIIDIVKQVFDYYNLTFQADTEIPDIQDIDSYYTGNGKRLFVVSDSNYCLGCAGLSLTNAHAELKRVYIHPQYWNNGIGSDLVNHALNIAGSHKKNYVELWSDTRFERSHRFYENLGFIYSGRVRPLNDINKSFEYHFYKTLDGE